MIKHYILEGHEVKEVNLMTWAKWFETGDRHIAKDIVGDITVSTIFLGIDHSFGEGTPLLFETRVFGGEHDGDMDRYSTREQAEDGHIKMLNKAKPNQ